MALRARLTPPREERNVWPWHAPTVTSLPASLLMGRDRRMEAENYLVGGYGIRLALEARKAGWAPLESIANVWQPSRLKGILVSPEFGTPFLAATQAFDLRPTPRKWLSLDRTDNSGQRFVSEGMILVTCSGSVGRATLAHAPHQNTLISHDLLRVEPKRPEWWGWLYAFLRSPQGRAMMTAAQYGHVVKHLEVGHLNSLPIPIPHDEVLADFSARARNILEKRNRAYALIQEAEVLFESTIGKFTPSDDPEIGFSVPSGDLFGHRRRLDGGYHTPTAATILRQFKRRQLHVETLADVTERVWWMTRFKRYYGESGMPYMSADELFSVNPPVTKKIIVEQADNADDFYVKAGWIVMARSGQTYGLNGSVALITEKLKSVFLSDDIIRIIPDIQCIRPGYLFLVLGHPTVGRPLVIRNAYGTSIPHLDPGDIATLPVVRLGDSLETDIADQAEEAVRLRAEADALEDELAADAESLVNRFIQGETAEFSIA